MNLEIWTYILGGATLFVLIVGFFSVYNGRMTRREIQRSIEKMEERSDKRLTAIEEILKRLERILETNTSILSRIVEAKS